MFGGGNKHTVDNMLMAHVSISSSPQPLKHFHIRNMYQEYQGKIVPWPSDPLLCMWLLLSIQELQEEPQEARRIHQAAAEEAGSLERSIRRHRCQEITRLECYTFGRQGH